VINSVEAFWKLVKEDQAVIQDSEVKTEEFAAKPKIPILPVIAKTYKMVMVLLTSMCSILQITKTLSFQHILMLGYKLLLMAILTMPYGVLLKVVETETSMKYKKKH